jgi:hypothetical protein
MMMRWTSKMHAEYLALTLFIFAYLIAALDG